MEKDIIEKYIQFAHINWFMNNQSYSTYWCEVWKWDFSISYWYNKWNTFIETKYFHFIELITSKEFIEAIARWYIKTKIHSSKALEENINNTINIFLQKYSDKITKEQAIAIRDNKLEEFIKTILPNN